MRLFFGIPLEPAAVERLAAAVGNVRSPQDQLRWTSPGSWHITLAFLGETPLEKYACLVDAARRIRSAPFPFHISRFGTFERAGVLFAEVDRSSELSRLEEKVRNITLSCGFGSEEREFHPHITVARAKGDHRLSALRKLRSRVRVRLDLPPSNAGEFRLYETVLGPGGAQYQVRESFPLSET